MNTVIFTAHPSKDCFAHKIAKRYKEAKEGKAEIVDLYSKEFRLDFLFFENESEIPQKASQNKAVTTLQEKIRNADELVFVYPVWWGGMPAILKNFIDNVFVSGFAYDFDEKGKLHKLMKGKRVRIFMTGNADSKLYLILKPFYNFLFKKVIFGFCGFQVLSIDILTSKFKRSERKLEAFLQKVEKRAKSI